MGLPGYHPKAAATTSTEELRAINEMKAASTQEDVAALMTATFTARRRAVVLESATIAEIHEDFTPLFQRTEVRPVQRDCFIIKSELRSRPFFLLGFLNYLNQKLREPNWGGGICRFHESSL